ncbi:MAG: hypothetical protein KME10_28000 [Plectolyngbya sp. WJT66-NPBG17]|jgi:hypothetical protein|nr:hypothetical protein [Plectolyngbya sp. WJT66-NPBG17]
MNYGNPITLEAEVTSTDITSDRTITVSEFCELHGITSDDFLSLRRRAARIYPGIDFKPEREGSRTFWVQGREILAQMAQEGKAKQVRTNEETPILPTQKLLDGSQLVIRKQASIAAIPVTIAPNEREVIVIDSDPLQQFNDALKADIEAEKQAKQETDLLQFAYAAQNTKRQKETIEFLIEKGYTPEQAVKIANGVT